MAIALGEGLMHNMKIKILNLNNNLIKDGGAIVIANALTIMKCAVEELNLSCNQIEKKGGKVFANMIKQNERLIKCDLSYNNIGDRAGEALVKSISHNSKI